MEQNTATETAGDNIQALKSQIASLESELAATKAQLQVQIPASIAGTPSAPLHLWLLLADSALPIGSFAFSSGLESYISHRSLRPVTTPKPSPRAELTRFLRLSLLSVSTTTIPFIAAAFRSPSSVLELDDTFDATTTCEVARRASVSQGRALCSVWDKSFASSLLKVGSSSAASGDSDSGSDDDNIPIHHRPDHFGPAWGYITRLTGLGDTPEALHQVLFVFLFNHVKALLSAAVRLSLIGPYVAQQILGSEEVGRLVCEAVERGRKVRVEEAGQCVPVLDLWQGRHERLYTRIFNS
ncbi:hypothetical protein TWF730_005756 [Orbilia blumenaviensis]|uniref:Urease accessory protein UreF n=1 Tax=Orbilia blumenaviensis TaxID=1796055 RepID=A0AAV9VMI2_9PEZI